MAAREVCGGQAHVFGFGRLLGRRRDELGFVADGKSRRRHADADAGQSHGHKSRDRVGQQLGVS
jgi:hypothetical protein